MVGIGSHESDPPHSHSLLPCPRFARCTYYERGREDLEAIRQRHYNADVQQDVVKHLAASHGWRVQSASALASAFEYLRWELLGVRRFPGVKVNIAAYWQQFRQRSNADEENPALSLMFSVRRQYAFLQPITFLPPCIFGNRDLNLKDFSALLNNYVDDQYRFAACVSDYLRRNRLTDVFAVAGTQSPTLPVPSEPLLMLPDWSDEDESEWLPSTEDNIHDQVETEASSPFQYKGNNEYRIYDARYDQVIYSTKASEAPSSSLTKTQEQVVLRQRQTVKRLARELANRLLARSQPEWREDIDDGRLFPARFSRIVTSPHLPPMRLKECRRDQRDSVICLLLDQSGSMRGLPSRLGLECCALLAESLDICGIKTEILGFTTASRENNHPLKHWRAQGGPLQPGRLNSLRHIIYKTADQPWRKTRSRFSAVLTDTMMQENIDGEALLWARSRLMCRPEVRKLLIVIGDGKPCDPATREANGQNFLDNHLLSVVEQIEREKIIELSAIGTSPALSRYYANAVMLSQVETLGKVLLEQVRKLFLQ